MSVFSFHTLIFSFVVLCHKNWGVLSRVFVKVEGKAPTIVDRNLEEWRVEWRGEVGATSRSRGCMC